MCWVRAGGWLSAWGWGNYLKYLKRGCNRNEGRRNKDFKKGASWVKGSVSPKGGAGTPLQTMLCIGISLPISYLAKFWFLIFGPICCWPVKLQDSLNCDISRAKWMMKFIFGIQINMEVFYKLILWWWSWFLHLDKHQRFLQINTII